MEVTLGGDRLGSGNKQKVDLKNYERSSHDLGYVWRSTMACGTLVPFMTEVGLVGDSFDINLDCVMKTHPTVGPLFGSYKVQLDVFKIPVRLYNGKLHMNLLGIGLRMNEIKLPQVKIWGAEPTANEDYDNAQINPSSLFSYLNIRGIGHAIGVEVGEPVTEIWREFNAIPWLGYWDIYKNYYANKQEGIAIGGATGGRGAVIHTVLEVNDVEVDTATVYDNVGDPYTIVESASPGTGQDVGTGPNLKVVFDFSSVNDLDVEQIYISSGGGTDRYNRLIDLFQNYTYDAGTEVLTFLNPKSPLDSPIGTWPTGTYKFGTEPSERNDITPRVQLFDLSDIDMMRKLILQDVSSVPAFVIDEDTPLNVTPYNYILQRRDIASIDRYIHACEFSQEGLGLKTYQSDLFNNWMSTEYIDGENGINAITAIDTSDGNFTIDTLQLSRKVYDMLNRIAISGGSYNDWIRAVYSENGIGGSENPIYCGGLSKELVFEEIFSNSESSSGQPLGTLAGKGTMSGKHKGGKVNIRCEEPCYIMGIVSITPRLDYSQGNKWDVNLKTMDDFHKPALDEIGFQDLITDQMAWWDTTIDAGVPSYRSAGKQPAWLNYMTNINQVRGNFARIDNEMFMTLNRRYEAEFNSNDTGNKRMIMEDLTTYIDPAKFNYVFAETNRDAQNFWAQIKVDIYARRKMSAKLMPNL